MNTKHTQTNHGRFGRKLTTLDEHRQTDHYNGVELLTSLNEHKTQMTKWFPENHIHVCRRVLSFITNIQLSIRSYKTFLYLQPLSYHHV